MTSARGIFTLNQVLEEKLLDNWSNLDNVWIDSVPNTGYFGGGTVFSGPGRLTTIEKLRYDTDTIETSPNLNLPVQLSGLAATGNSTAGYFAAGYFPYTSATYKLTYFGDTIVYTPSANLSSAREGHTAAGNSTAGYFGGGLLPGSVQVSTMDKITYSTDLRTLIPTGFLSNPGAFDFAASGNADVGYFIAGASVFSAGPPYSGSDKITYSTDTTVRAPSLADLSSITDYHASAGNSTAAYVGGGSRDTGVSYITEKITYSNDTRSSLPALGYLNIPGAVSPGTFIATGNLQGGYFSKGKYTSILDRINYSTDTTSLIPFAFVSKSGGRAATSAKENALPQKWTRFSDGFETTDSELIPQATLTSQVVESSTPNTGYFGGGSVPGPLDPTTTMDKLTYSTDTTLATPSAYLTLVSSVNAATGSSTSGYFTVGPSGSTLNKLTYSTDTTSAPGIKLGRSQYRPGAAGSSEAGYFVGGRTLPSSTLFWSITDKLTYSTDTVVATPSAYISTPSGYMGATGSSTAGYFGGHGEAGPYRSSVFKLRYTVDSFISTPTSNLNSSRGQLAATGSSTAGYFGGGLTNFFPAVLSSTIDKLNYSTDVVEALTGVNLNPSRDGYAATGNQTLGYFGGGSISFSSMSKLTYSTDTIQVAPISANLSIARDNLSAVSASPSPIPISI